MSSDSRYKSLSYELETFSESAVAKISVEAVRRVARMDADASKKFPVRAVAIVGSQELIRGLNNLYRLQHEATGGHWTTTYFDTEEEARQWLAEMLDE